MSDEEQPPQWRNRYSPGNGFFYAQPVIPGEVYDDGWAHERDEDGWCKNCMAPPGCSHARLVPKADALEGSNQ